MATLRMAILSQTEVDELRTLSVIHGFSLSGVGPGDSLGSKVGVFPTWTATVSGDAGVLEMLAKEFFIDPNLVRD